MSASMGGDGRRRQPGAETSRRRPGPSSEDLEALARYAAALADGVQAALPGWVERSVERVHVETLLRRPPAEVREAAAARRARRRGRRRRPGARPARPRHRRAAHRPARPGPPGRAVPDRGAARAGVPPVDRDEFAARQFPDDVYDLAPTSFAELDPDLHEVGLVWGAAKAHVHLARRRADGQR